jgi:hypothetical protein
MVTWRIVDDDVECLHVERNPTMACSGSHLYKFYRFSIDACTVDQTGGNGERLQEIHDLGLGSLFHPPFPRIYKKEERVFFLQFLHCHRCIYLAKENWTIVTHTHTSNKPDQIFWSPKFYLVMLYLGGRGNTIHRSFSISFTGNWQLLL